MTLDRRTVVRGTAWSVPVLAVSAQAPAFAASVCGAVPFTDGWTLLKTGSFKASSGIQGYTTSYVSAANGANVVDTIHRYVSEQDSADPANADRETDASDSSTITLSKALTLVPLRSYTFSFDIASRFSGDTSAASQSQFLQIQTVVGNTATDRLRLVKGSSDTTHMGLLAGQWTQLTPATSTQGSSNAGVRTQTISFSYTPPAGVSSVTLRYVYTLPSRRRSANNVYSGQADIAVSAPTITGDGC